MKAFITKYALSSGITEQEVEYVGGATQMVSWKIDGWSNTAHHEGKDWTRTKDEAITRANFMRLKKIQSIKKQIKNLEALKFT